MNILSQSSKFLTKGINATFEGVQAWKVVAITTTAVLSTVWLVELVLYDEESVYERGKKRVFKLARLIPAVRNKIDGELKGLSETFEKDVATRTGHLDYTIALPENGLKQNQIELLLKNNLNMSDFDWKSGYASGSVYQYDEELITLVTKVYGETAYTNPLHPDLFPGLCKMEAEVLKMALTLFRGGENAGGTISSGGTESILLACKALRDYGREEKGIKYPEMVVPCTAHSAFDKAAKYLKIKVRSIPVDQQYWRVDLKAMKQAINSNTVMLVGSAPNFPYGTMDDIQLISDLGLKYNVPVHVDSCLGGFLTCFMEEAGYPLPLCDFRLDGVVSISADTHKYGYAPKGSSLVMYRDKKYLHHQYTVTTDWPGGVYGSPTISGSRAGGNIAVCWASLLYHGKAGYLKHTKDIIHTTRYIERGLRRLKEIFIFGQPATSVIGIGSYVFEIYRLSDGMHKLGWNLNALQFPSGIHICVTQMHTRPGVADRFLKDIKTCLTEIMKDPKQPTEGKMALYGMAQTLPDRSIVGDFTRLYLDSMYYIPPKPQTN